MYGRMYGRDLDFEWRRRKRFREIMGADWSYSMPTEDDDLLEYWWHRNGFLRLQNLRSDDWSLSTQMDFDFFEYRWRRRSRNSPDTSEPHSGDPKYILKSTAEAERLQVLEAVGRAKALKLCLRRIWAVASSLPGRENSLPELIPVPGTFSIPGHDRERHEHEQCTFDFCEQSRVDFTSVAQHHETPCRGNCEQITFPLGLLSDRVTKGKSTAWRLDEPSLLDASRPYMAISHVWSDGTGSGIWGPGKVNKCLYAFFSKIAHSFQCDGCWWDSISIPLDDETRTKALSSMHINYSNSRITLVHDLYLREWEWVDSETACFAIVMSPWYSRGWTALELAQSHKVKIMFKAKNNKYVIKDLDVDILAKVPESHSTADAIRKLRRASIEKFGTLLAILGARDTSKPRDVPIISGLLAGVDVSGGLSQQEIYQRILRKLGKIAQGHLFHNSATMSAPGFSWCPTNILDMPMAESGSVMLTLHENGDLEGGWKVQAIDTVKVEDLITRGIHPLTQVSLESAFCGESTEKHVLLLEMNEPKIVSRDRRALLVRLMGNSDGIVAKFVGPVYFRAPRGSAEKEDSEKKNAEQRDAEQKDAEQMDAEQNDAEQKGAEQKHAEQKDLEQKDVEQLQIKVRIGSTEGLDDVPGVAWEYLQTQMKEAAPTTEEKPAKGHGLSTTKPDAALNNDGAFHSISQDWRAIFFMDGDPEEKSETSLFEDKYRVSLSSKNSKSQIQDEMPMFFHHGNNSGPRRRRRAFFCGNKGMVNKDMIEKVEAWLGRNPNFTRGQATVLSLGNDKEVEIGENLEGSDVKQLLTRALLLAIENSNVGNTNMTALITLLLDIKAPHQRDTSRRTPLHIALERHNYDIVKILLQNKSSPAPVDTTKADSRALSLASKDLEMPDDVFRMLVKRTDDVNVRHPFVGTPHIWAPRKSLTAMNTLFL